jgi:hypothetical protein
VVERKQKIDDLKIRKRYFKWKSNLVKDLSYRKERTAGTAWPQNPLHQFYLTLQDPQERLKLLRPQCRRRRCFRELRKTRVWLMNCHRMDTSPSSADGIATDYGWTSGGIVKYHHVSIPPRPALGSVQQDIQRKRGWGWGLLSLGVKRQECETEHSPPTSAEVVPCGRLRADVSEERTASIIWVTRVGELGTTLAVTSNRSNCEEILADSVTLMMQALRSTQKSILTRATRRNITEDCIMHSHRREHLKSYMRVGLYNHLTSTIIFTS